MKTFLTLYYFLQACEDILDFKLCNQGNERMSQRGSQREEGMEGEEGKTMKNIGNDCQWVKIFSSIRYQFGENILSAGKIAFWKLNESVS